MSFGQDEAIREFKELTSIASTTTLSISTTSNSDSLLHSALVQLNPTNRSSFAQIKSIIANVHPSFNFDGETTLTQELFLKSLTIRMNSLILEKLFDQVSELQKENDFWSKIENSSLNTSLFLVQTTPSRLASLAMNTISRLRQITTTAINEPNSPFSLSTLRQALPNRSLILASLFPRLSSITNLEDGRITRRILMIGMQSPFRLAMDEIKGIRRKIEESIAELAEKIGILTIESSSMSDRQKGKQVVSTTDEARSLIIQKSTGKTLQRLSNMFGVEPLANSLETITNLLENMIPNDTKKFTALKLEISRPSLLTRSWPYLIIVPFTTSFLVKQIYQSRNAIKEAVLDFQETISRFLIDWVFEPVKKILNTVRHGEGSLAFMGRESLKSDLESLERMVIDFGRDEYGMSGSQLDLLRQKVQNGNLEDVLKVWEADIKKPIRSAIGGTLIRTLLIQIQKGKVDGAMAVEGIQKLMQSQELTFAAIGIAPSILILFGFTKWVRGFFSGSEMKGKKGRKLTERKLWLTLRQLDLIISPPPISSYSLSSTQSQGFLLLSLASLRDYANSKYFSKDSFLKEQFLEDVRGLENSGEADEGRRRMLLDRVRRWSELIKGI